MCFSIESWFRDIIKGTMKCRVCGKERLISEALSVCGECVEKNWWKVKPLVVKAHKKAKKRFGLPYPAPRAKDGIFCNVCVNQCRIGEGELSFCGLRTNRKGKLIHLAGTPKKGILQWYYDPLPTNCVAAWVCGAGQNIGQRMKNLAVFYGACSLDCLFCQNWHYRELSRRLSPVVSAKELTLQADTQTFCLCFFGGDPTPQLAHAFAVTKLLENKNIRICFETNGSMNQNLARKMAKIALKTGGIVKFDLKTYDEHLNIALTGVSNEFTLENFKMLAKEFLPRAKGPFLTASTLLVPGYVEADEVDKIASFIAKLDKNIPYSLLAFAGAFEMTDLPTTSWQQAQACQKAALEAGLTKVRLGNIHLLR